MTKNMLSQKSQTSDQSAVRPAGRIVQITDLHVFADNEVTLLGVNTAQALQGVLDHIQQHQSDYDLLLVTGDISQDGTAGSYELIKQMLQPLCENILYLPGNHDVNAPMQQVLKGQTGPIFDIGPWRIVALDTMVPDSDAGYLEPDQFENIKKACTENLGQTQYVLLTMHHNPIPMGSAWLDPMGIANAHDLFAYCEQYPSIQGMVWGHVHQAFDSYFPVGAERRLLKLMSTPATCIQFAPHSSSFALGKKDPGYRVIELYPDGSIQTQVQRVGGLGIEPDLDSKGY